jgi:flagellar protein FlaJ
MKELEKYKKISVRLFGDMVDKYIKHFEPLKPHLSGAGIQILLKTWVCIILFGATMVYIISFAVSMVIVMMFDFGALFLIYFIIFIPILAASFAFVFFYIYPIQKANSIKNEIENNLPFALAHMSAIVSSGIPPEHMFDMLTDFEEYGGIAQHAEMIVRNIRTFGMSSTRAINDVANKTPSQTFRQVLMGITTTIQKGGNLVDYIKEMSDKALFEYSMRREKYLKTLSTYADIYTALLVAAPLMMLAILGVMSIIGGEVMGLGIGDLITLITWVILPAVNASFLAFIHTTYPGI